MKRILDLVWLSITASIVIAIGLVAAVVGAVQLVMGANLYRDMWIWIGLALLVGGMAKVAWEALAERDQLYAELVAARTSGITQRRTRTAYEIDGGSLKTNKTVLGEGVDTGYRARNAEIQTDETEMN